MTRSFSSNSTATGETGDPARDAVWSRISQEPATQFLVLLFVFTFPAILFLRNFFMTDPDFGWHLRAGEWILSHHQVPYTDPFSIYGAGKPWYDYSWLFDLFFVWLYRQFGLVGFALLEVAARVAIPVCIYRLARSLDLSFWLSTLTTAFAAYSMQSIYAPRPGMFTIVFFILELQIIFSALLQNKFSRLFFLPPLFLVWACIHIQFIHGLIVLALFTGEPILNFILRYKPDVPTLPAKSLWVFGASVLATFFTPYGWHIYTTVFQYAGQKHIYEVITEMLPMNFREPFHFGLLFLVLGAALAIGWSRNFRPNYLLLFAFSAVIGFRSIKDVWLIAVVSTALIAISMQRAGGSSPRFSGLSREHQLALTVCVVAILAVAWRRYDLSNTWLEMGLAGKYPEAAARYVEKNHLQGPLYNDFTSGGFLIWRLPSLPVSMDGRTNVHGDDRVKAYSNAMRGIPGWENDPDLARANLIIWTAKSPLPGLLRCDPRFKQVFEDPQTVVFVRR